MLSRNSRSRRISIFSSAVKEMESECVYMCVHSGTRDQKESKPPSSATMTFYFFPSPFFNLSSPSRQFKYFLSRSLIFIIFYSYTLHSNVCAAAGRNIVSTERVSTSFTTRVDKDGPLEKHGLKHRSQFLLTFASSHLTALVVRFLRGIIGRSNKNEISGWMGWWELNAMHFKRIRSLLDNSISTRILDFIKSYEASVPSSQLTENTESRSTCVF